ncbi:MAG: archaellin/type IV pilin N-terminal domain-containing protein [Candidatus Altiarchaeota archaeon]
MVLLASSKQTRLQRGMMGIGTLILFLAIILVASLASLVLISTGTSLQQKALITGNEAREGIASGLEVVSIRGTDASQSGTPHEITRLYLMARLPPGSSPMNLNTTTMSMDTTEASQTFTYGGTVADGTLASGTGTFVVSYMQSGPYQQDNYVNLGDMVKVRVNIDGDLGEHMKARLTILPRTGNVNQLEFVTPESMVEPVVVLWPTS